MHELQRDPATVPIGLLAADLVDILECESLHDLGKACQNALYRFTGSEAIGIYLTRKSGPHLLFSSDVPSGFLEEYGSTFGPTDPLIRGLGEALPVVDATTSLGPNSWRKSSQYGLLQSWGFSECMCGLMRNRRTHLGVMYTATKRKQHRYSAEEKQQMQYLCQGASIALNAILRDDAGNNALPPQLARVAHLLCEGKSNKEIANACNLSIHTVKEYVQTLIQRYGVDNRTALAVSLVRSEVLN